MFVEKVRMPVARHKSSTSNLISNRNEETVNTKTIACEYFNYTYPVQLYSLEG